MLLYITTSGLIAANHQLQTPNFKRHTTHSLPIWNWTLMFEVDIFLNRLKHSSTPLVSASGRGNATERERSRSPRERVSSTPSWSSDRLPMESAPARRR